jgi:hypothetical protein
MLKMVSVVIATLASDRDHGAGNPARLDVGIQRGADARKPLAGEAGLLGLCARQRVFGKGGGRCEQAQRTRDCSDGQH